MLVPHRTFSSPEYRYGFNEMEKDDELKGNGNSYTTQFRGYDPRIGRWFSIDRLSSKYPHQSPYIGFNNNPIYFKDPTGLEGDPPNVNKIQNIDRKLINSLVDMGGSNAKTTNSLGWARDSKYFWNKFKSSDLGKDALSTDNLSRIGKGLSPEVDGQWNKIMEKYDLDGKAGEGIEHHHHNKGRTAYPRPKSKHTGKAWNKVLHNLNKRLGRVNTKSGKFKKLHKTKNGILSRGLKGLRVLGVIADVSSFKDVIDDHPDSPFNDTNLITTWEMNKPYNNGFGGYMEIISYDKSYGTYTIQNFEGIEKINGRYRGVLKSGNTQTYRVGTMLKSNDKL